MKNKHIGSNFDDFLKEEDFLIGAEANAIKRVVSYQISKLMAEKKITKTKMAQSMNTSRSAVDRLLEPKKNSLTILTLEKVAKALGKKLKIEFV